MCAQADEGRAARSLHGPLRPAGAPQPRHDDAGQQDADDIRERERQVDDRTENEELPPDRQAGGRIGELGQECQGTRVRSFG